MSLFDDLLKQMSPSPLLSPSRADELCLAEVARQYQNHISRQQRDMLASGLMGVPAGLGQYGPGGALTRSGLGPARATYPSPLPESTVVSAVSGWRRWSVTMFGSLLLSNNGTAWEPFQRLTADCNQRQNCQGYVCGCGIYAYKERERAENGENAPSAITHVWGEVWLWGRIIECEHGFRAQFAYPKAIVDTGSIAQQVAIAYGINVIPSK